MDGPLTNRKHIHLYNFAWLGLWRNWITFSFNYICITSLIHCSDTPVHVFALLIHPDPDISGSTPGISETDYGQSSLSPGAFVLVKYPHQKQAVQSR